MNKSDNLKVCMYVQTDDKRNVSDYGEMLNVVRKANVDLLVFPETCYTPFIKKMWDDLDFFDGDIQKQFIDYCLALSKNIQTAVIVGSEDIHGAIFSIYANANAKDGETETEIYYKHTMTGFSAFDYTDYEDDIDESFPLIYLKGCALGMTICYDCNHAIFSTMYGQRNVDVIVNSTGGDVTRDKWYKYNKVRAIENNCYNLVTMGGSNDHYCGSMGFNRVGGELEYKDLGNGLHLYEIDMNSDCLATVEEGINQTPSVSKYQDICLPERIWTDHLAKGKAKQIDDYIYVEPYTYKRESKTVNANIVYCVAEDDLIEMPEFIVELMYRPCLKKYANKRYVIVCKNDDLDQEYFEQILSVVLKVRAMENFCAVMMESNIGCKCYQTSLNRVSQTVKAVNGKFGLDLDRTTGPEAIWKNKQGMRASWRNGYEALLRLARERLDEALQYEEDAEE